MKRILVTGARGFLGRNLAVHLMQREDCAVRLFDLGNSPEQLRAGLFEADVVYHLAGVNRPRDPREFETGNAGLAETICEELRAGGRRPKIVFSSSVQADLDNAYGISKKRAEDALIQFGADTGACIRIYRLKNLFGKWCRPNYNSVTATFCHNIANDLPISISDSARELELSYVDDVVASFLSEIDSTPPCEPGADIRSYRIQLGDLAGRIQAFHGMGESLAMPDFDEWFNRALYATYLSHVPMADMQRELPTRTDDRGALAELIKSPHSGQIFVSSTKPGVTRGNHYHHTKTEKFFVVHGEGLIQMRAIEGGPVQEFRVSGTRYQVVDIPTGFTHSITNVGNSEMVTLFWSSEVFDPNRPDTYYLPVVSEEQVEVLQKEGA